MFFPAYNDAPSLPGLVEATFEVLRANVADYEVIVVNDGSRDNTGEVLEELRRKHAPRMRVVTHKKNRGYGGALRSGFAAARKEWVFYTDGDGQYDVREIHRLLAELKPNIDLVNGYKVKRADAWYRIWIGAFYRRAMRWVFRLSIRDVDCDFLRSRAVAGLHIHLDLFCRGIDG